MWYGVQTVHSCIYLMLFVQQQIKNIHKLLEKKIPQKIPQVLTKMTLNTINYKMLTHISWWIKISCIAVHLGRILRLLYNLQDTKTFHLKGAPYVPHSITFSLQPFKETFEMFFLQNTLKKMINFAERRHSSHHDHGYAINRSIWNCWWIRSHYTSTNRALLFIKVLIILQNASVQATN